MSASILTSTKNALGIDVNNTDFDAQVLMHINSVFSTINQLGIGPANGLMIEDATPTWVDLIGNDLRMNSIKTYVYLGVRLLFDPPTTSYLITAMEKQKEEIEYRLSMVREGDSWTNPNPPTIPDEDEVVLDGGDP